MISSCINRIISHIEKKNKNKNNEEDKAESCQGGHRDLDCRVRKSFSQELLLKLLSDAYKSVMEFGGGMKFNYKDYNGL